MVLPEGVALFARVGAFGGASHLTLADFFASAPAVGLAPASFDCIPKFLQILVADLLESK